MTLEDSTTYQLILNKGFKQGEVQGEARGEARGRSEGRVEGRVAEAQSLVLRIGTRRFGTPAAETESMLRALTDPDRLERIADRLLDASGWDDLLATA